MIAYAIVKGVHTVLLLLAIVVLLSSLPLSSKNPENSESNRLLLVEAYGSLPLSFEANQGQTDPEVKFLSRGRGYTLFLTATEAVLALRSKDETPVLRIKLVGANPQAKVSGLGKLPGRSNYFLGNDSKKWRTNISNYAQVKYSDIYPGIDLVYYGNQGHMEHDFIVAPGVSPKIIRLGFDGAGTLASGDHGDIVLQVRDSEVRLRKPFAYQEVNGVRQEIPSAYMLKDNHQVGFEVGAYDATRPLIIDPVLEYSTYLGGTGSGSDTGLGIAVDDSGNVYVAGITDSADYPVTTGGFQLSSGGQRDAFVTKLNPAGNGLVYSTYLGGSGNDGANSIAVDTTGNAYVTGETGSSNFPTKDPLQPFFGGGTCGTSSGSVPCGEVFLTKLNPTGNGLVYSTYLGGAGVDIAWGIAIDSVGNAYLTGRTGSTNFPITPGVFQGTKAVGTDTFVAKVNATGSALLYSTYLGSNSVDHGRAIAADSNGNAYVTGFTTSGDGVTNDFPTTPGAFQVTYGGGTGGDAFVTKLDPTGSAIVYSTYLGGSGADRGFGIAVDASGNAYVTGETQSTNFPTARPFQGAKGGGTADAFVAKLNTDGSALLYSTYLGGNSSEIGNGIAADESGNAYVTGVTFSTDFPTENPFQSACGGCTGTFDGFVAILNTPTSGPASLMFSSYLGGGAGDKGTSIAVDPLGSAFLTGQTSSTDFPTTLGAFQTAFQGGQSDAFVVKVSPASDLAITKTDSPDPVMLTDSLTYELIVSNNGPGEATNLALTDTLPGNVTLVSTSATQGSCSLSGTSTLLCGLGSLANGANATVTIITTPSAGGTITNTVNVTSREFDPDTADNIETIETTVSDFAIGVSPDNATVTRGQSASYTVTVTPQFGPFGNSIALACSNLPALASCMSSPRSLTPNSSSVTSTVTVSTTAPSAFLTPPFGPRDDAPFYALWLGLPGLAVVGLALAGQKPKKVKPGFYLSLSLLLALLVLQVACGGGGATTSSQPPPRPGTPTGTFNITITGTAGSLQHSTTATLVVQ